MRKAFTLIELLVVIAIIGILSSITIVGVTNSKTKARDVTRKADLHSIKAALDVFFADQNPNAFPDYKTHTVISYDMFLPTGQTTQTYLKSVPTDPTQGQNYMYICDDAKENYLISAKLENANDADIKPLRQGIGLSMPAGHNYWMENE